MVTPVDLITRPMAAINSEDGTYGERNQQDHSEQAGPS